MVKSPTCIYCDQGENEVPLLQFTFRSVKYWVCLQHLPILIHHPEQLADKVPALAGFSRVEGRE